MSRYEGYQCQDLREWRKIMEEKLDHACAFEIHCWKEEEAEISKALQFGVLKETPWTHGSVIVGKVSPGFKAMLLEAEEPKNQETYPKKTAFFSIFLDNGFSSEHYGCELNEQVEEMNRGE